MFTTACWAVCAIAALIVAVPQSILLVRTAPDRDDLWWFRLKSSLVFGSLGLAMIRNVAIWADYVFFDQRYLGMIEQRWPLDLALSVLIMAGCILAAVLYIQTQFEARP